MKPWITFSEFEDNYLPEYGRVNPPVNYDDATHRYFHENTTYTSATQLLSQFKHKFPFRKRTEYMADKYGKDPAYWEQRWNQVRDDSLVRGNEIHNRKERSLYIKKIIQHEVGTLTVRTQKDFPNIDYYNLSDGVYPELLLWNHKYKIAGRADKVILWTDKVQTSPGEWEIRRYADVEDYKTNKIIYTSSFKDEKTGKFRMMLDPISHIMDCEMEHYKLQLSIYQFMLECFGFRPGKRVIIHIQHEIEGLGVPDPVRHSVPYMRNEVVSMIKYNLCKNRA